MYQIQTKPFNIKLKCNPDIKTKFIEIARSYVGVKFVHQGRSRRGVDCAGLLLMIINEVLKTDLSVINYPKWPNPPEMRKLLNIFLIPIKREELELGDIILMRGESGNVSHLGWYANNTIIHASNAPGIMKVIEHRLNNQFKKAIVGCWAVPEYD